MHTRVIQEVSHLYPRRTEELAKRYSGATSALTNNNSRIKGRVQAVSQNFSLSTRKYVCRNGKLSHSNNEYLNPRDSLYKQICNDGTPFVRKPR